MSYGKLLQKIISDANLSYKEVAERCTANGKKIDPSYISKLVNGKIFSPSEQITKMIAEVCGVNPNKLIIEGYVDKAPDEIKKFIDNIRINTQFSHLDSIENNRDIYEKSLENQSIAEFILEYNMAPINSNGTPSVVGIPINDDSMAPLIPKNSQIIISRFDNERLEMIEEENNNRLDNISFFSNAKDGDIVVGWDFESSDIVMGMLRMLDLEYYNGDFHEYMLIPINGRYPILDYDLSHTYFNLISLKKDKLVINEKLMEKTRPNSVVNNVTAYYHMKGICILGKVTKVINSIV